MANQDYYYAVGRRKTSVATVRVYFKKGKSTINDKSVSDIYPNVVEQALIMSPFKVAEIDAEDVMFTAKTIGGGIMSQLDAIKLGIARAIVKRTPDAKKALKDAGMLTRDSRMVERKKPGLRKARKSEQYSKR